MSARRMVVTREVPAEENGNYLGRTALKGEHFYEFLHNTFGCVGPEGVALSEQPDECPFFQFPRDAVVSEQT